MNKSALTIAGSDPSGGAGIQSDLRAFLSIGVAGLSALSAITVQNSSGVSAVHPVDASILSAQLSAILNDTEPDAVKVGMLGSADQVTAIASAIERRNLRNVVLDPVLASTGGVPFLDTAGRYLLLTTLFPICDLVTPNLAEASAITGLVVDSQESMLHAGNQLLAVGCKAVLMKGGHLNGSPTDMLIRRDHPPMEFHAFRVETEHTHGTGCLLSSAIAAYLALGDDLPSAIMHAKQVLTAALKTPIVVGKDRGYPNPRNAPCHSDAANKRTHEERLEMIRGIYVVTDQASQRGRSIEDVVTAALAGGAQVVQLREKSLSTPDLICLARRVGALVHSRDKLFIVNDRVDVALASDADGVHLGPDDMHPRDARTLLGPERLVGVSTGSVAEALAAAPWVSYFGVGCIFGTQTKRDAGDAIGPQRITEIKSRVSGIPTVAIGGITEANIEQIVEAGATSAAVASAVVGAEDIESATKKLVALFA
jgi:hydroxymethylpyrimidine kinase / phosphomethylpyrimidine kinase / thiamine-phosphate diphosphorylase